MDTIASLLDARDRALAIHDLALVREIDAALARNGYRPLETTVRRTERAVPAKRKRR